MIMKKRHILPALLAALVFTMQMPGTVSADGTRQVLVTNSQELIDALADAKAGDEIILREGTYENDKWLGKYASFYGEAAGTAEHPIVVRSEDAAHPATILGADVSKKYGFYVIGDYWRLENLRVGHSGKGIVLDKSSHSVLSGCEVFEIGDEGIHIRDNSAYCLIENCNVHDTGLVNAKYGEGIYIGSAIGTEEYGFDCHYNTVRGCNISRVGAECVDIKEFTYGTLVEDCIFDGSCIAGENGANSFIEIKGNDVIVRNNVGYRNGNEQQLYGFDLYCPTPEWGQNAKIYDNTLYLDDAEVNSVAGWKCSAQVFRNTCDPPECAIGSNGNRIMDVRSYELPGDANEDGSLNADDVRTVQSWVHGQKVTHIADKNADLDGDGVLDVFDLALVKRAAMQKDAPKPVIEVGFHEEKTGKWRTSNGLGERSVTFSVHAEPGTSLDMAWMYWDPYFPNEETGKNGKSIVNSLGILEPDENGDLTITVELPADAVSLALEVWDYQGSAGKLDKSGVTLERVVTQ